MKRLENLTGQRFEKLTVTKYLGKDKYYNKIWECQCDCGNVNVIVVNP